MKFQCKKYILAITIVGVCLLLGNIAQTNTNKYIQMLDTKERVLGEAIVKFRQKESHTTQEKIQATQKMENILLSMGVSSFKKFATDNRFFKVTLSNDRDMARFLKEANRNPEISYTEPNYIYRSIGYRDSEITPNDPNFQKQWALHNTGQEDPRGQVGIAGADIGALEAWKITKGSKDIIVAVLDTGVDYNHRDLYTNIYRNHGEIGDGKQTNGIDDDGNGFIDDYIGWNFFHSSNNPMDNSVHGTHCAGIIGAEGNNDKGIVGVSWNVRILPIKFMSQHGVGTVVGAAQAIQYATKMGAHIMNNSWGGHEHSQAILDAIKEAKEAGILFVAAAGNETQNSDTIPHYPSSYPEENIISVAATDNSDYLSSFSNWGRELVDIAAPGSNIYSTVPNNKYASYSGTSMATPHVAGAAALLWSVNKEMTAIEIKDRLLRSRDTRLALSRKILSSGRLNINNAIRGIFPDQVRIPKENEWIDGDAIEPVESSHPYEGNSSQKWVIHGPENAKFMRVHFSRLELEEKFDFVHILDSKGNRMDVISGTSLNGTTSWFVVGNEITIKLKTDFSGAEWGFAINKFQYIAQ